MLFIVDNNLLNINSTLYDLLQNCINNLNVDIVNILIIDLDEFYYYKNYKYDNKNLLICMEKKYYLDYDSLSKIIIDMEIYCFYQEDFDYYYESIIFDLGNNFYGNYFNKDLRSISVIYFLNNSLNYYEDELLIRYDKSKLINTFYYNNCSKNIYIINKYHRDKPFRYITNCSHNINHIHYENNIYNKNKRFFLSSYINKYLNWIKTRNFDKYEILDIMFHSITIIIYISYYDIYKLNDLVYMFEKVFNNEQYNYSLTQYLNNNYLNIDNKFKNVSILLNFKLFINYYNNFIEIKKINETKFYNNNYLLANTKYYKKCYIFKLKNKIKYEKNNEEYVKSIINSEYPYISRLVNNNICIAGGFLRSLILNQKVNDIDFFIYGEIKNYFLLIDNFVSVIMNYFKNKYIIQLYKPQNKVLECLITTYDNIIIKIQLILVNHKNIDSLLSSFDLNPCKIAYDGFDIIKHKDCVEAYRYFINDIRNIDTTKCISMNYRIKKYLNYGFDIVCNKNDLLIKPNTVIKLSNNIMANVINIYDNVIEIDLITNTFSENKKEVSVSITKTYYTTLSIGNKEICDLINMKNIFGYVEIKCINILFFIIYKDNNLYIDGHDKFKEKFINNIIKESNIDK